MTNAWNIDAARFAYSVPHWSDGYVDIGADGRAVMRPRGAEGPADQHPTRGASAALTRRDR